MRRPITFSCAYPKPIVSATVRFPQRMPCERATRESKPLMGYNVFPTSSARHFYLCLPRGRATPIYTDVPLSSLSPAKNLPFRLG